MQDTRGDRFPPELDPVVRRVELDVVSDADRRGDQTEFDGELPHGEGKRTYAASGAVYAGQWAGGEPTGTGDWRHPSSGEVRRGSFVNGVLHGDGEETDPLTPAECGDGEDNDADGRIDFPADPQCNGPGDLSERR